MKQTFLITLLVFAMSSFAPAQDKEKKSGMQESKPATAGGDHLGKVEQEILQMERDWTAAIIKGDTAALQRITSSEWTFTAPDGRIQTRAEAEAELKSGDLKIQSSELEDIRVRIYGDVAIVKGRAMDKGQYKGQDISGRYSFTDVFIKRNGRWQAITSHVSRVAQ